jgi:5-methylcytosine-specific restriction endonuclease McrA
MENLVIINCADAKLIGLKRYFTGKPCKNGHVSERAVINGTCFGCKAEIQKRSYAVIGHKRRAYSKQYEKKNAEIISVKNRIYYRNNKEAFANRRDKWREENPDQVRKKAIIYSSNRRARLVKAEGSYTAEDVARIAALQNGKCAICRLKPKQLQVDHIQPLARGGSNWPRNLQLLCARCNASKCAQNPSDYMRSLGALL